MVGLSNQRASVSRSAVASGAGLGCGGTGGDDGQHDLLGDHSRAGRVLASLLHRHPVSARPFLYDGIVWVTDPDLSGFDARRGLAAFLCAVGRLSPWHGIGCDH